MLIAADGGLTMGTRYTTRNNRIAGAIAEAITEVLAPAAFYILATCTIVFMVYRALLDVTFQLSF